MSFPAWQQHLDVLHYPCLVFLCSSCSEWQQRGSKTLATGWDPQSWDPQRLWVPAITNRRNNLANKGARRSCNAKHPNVSCSHAGWLHLALGAVDPRICLVRGSQAAQMRYRIITSGPAQFTHRHPQLVFLPALCRDEKTPATVGPLSYMV